jgi:hypothetical protein
MRIALSIYDPGATKEGGRGYTTEFIKYLMKHYVECGHEVFWVQDGTPLYGSKLDWSYKDYNVFETNKIDVFLVMWRWSMPNVPDRHLTFAKQQHLLSMAFGAGTRVIVHDQDHMIDQSNYNYLATQGAVITAPELAPRRGFKKLMYAVDPTWEYTSNYYADGPREVIYVGNNYRRFHQAVRLLSSDKFNTIFYGNWLRPAADRESPTEVLRAIPNGKFNSWVDSDKVVETLREGFLTVHLAPPDYCDSGFCALRFVEAAKAGVLGLLPIEFVGANLPRELFVCTADDVAGSLEFDQKTYCDLLAAQRDFVQAEMGIDQWDKILEE